MKNIFYIGRGLDYAASLEGALKIKEIAYLHAESYQAGELKHGPLALVGPDFPCIFINPKGKHYVKTVSNIEEVRARSGTVLGIISK